MEDFSWRKCSSETKGKEWEGIDESRLFWNFCNEKNDEKNHDSWRELTENLRKIIPLFLSFVCRYKAYVDVKTLFIIFIIRNRVDIHP